MDDHEKLTGLSLLTLPRPSLPVAAHTFPISLPLFHCAQGTDWQKWSCDYIDKFLIINTGRLSVSLLSPRWAALSLILREGGGGDETEEERYGRKTEKDRKTDSVGKNLFWLSELKREREREREVRLHAMFTVCL